MSTVNQTIEYGRYAFGLRRFLRERATAERGREVITQRLQEREANFLALVRRAVFDNARSPYLPLLRHAGCEHGDLERMVGADGIEATLQRLYRSGVYVTIDEFKCRQPIVRGAATVVCTPGDFDNPFLAAGIQASSSGSRSAGTATTMSLERTGHNAMYNAVVFSAHGLQDRPTLLWMPILPSAAGLVMLLHYCKMGVPPVSWFSPVAAANIRPALSKRLATRYIVYAGRLFGSKVPAPEYVSGSQVHVVVRCLENILRQGRGCVVACTPSSAARASEVAWSSGIDLSGVTFMAGAEPLTPAKAKEISRAGARAVSMYASAEVGFIGFGCAGRTTACDDVHILEGSHAVIQHRRDTPFGGGPVQALLFSSIHDRAAKILLNVESGDYGVVETRDCGCELGSLGLRQHIHTIRSFDKLTGEGMTFVGTDFVRLMEEVLPARFGGASTDYQMVEMEDAASHTRMDVLVSPDVGVVDEEELVRVVLLELSRGSDTNRMMADVWRERDVLRVRRERPHVTAAGKLLTLHVMKTGGV
ncbi:MAG: hypothetical protein JXA58_08490 [Dehalococcoidia bacterium]|nr:hypothetical protein [Dehalococcoidia bacterium]